jgi:hypothetical protein
MHTVKITSTSSQSSSALYNLSCLKHLEVMKPFNSLLASFTSSTEGQGRDSTAIQKRLEGKLFVPLLGQPPALSFTIFHLKEANRHHWTTSSAKRMICCGNVHS